MKDPKKIQASKDWKQREKETKELNAYIDRLIYSNGGIVQKRRLDGTINYGKPARILG